MDVGSRSSATIASRSEGACACAAASGPPLDTAARDSLSMPMRRRSSRTWPCRVAGLHATTRRRKAVGIFAACSLSWESSAAESASGCCASRLGEAPSPVGCRASCVSAASRICALVATSSNATSWSVPKARACLERGGSIRHPRRSAHSTSASPGTHLVARTAAGRHWVARRPRAAPLPTAHARHSAST